MDVKTRNRLFSTGEIDREDLWPKITEFEEQPCTFRFTFGLEQLPEEAGIILIRGPRQYGKSTWLELKLKESLEEHGRGSAYFLNGDEIADDAELEARILEILPAFNPNAGSKRLFIDEISAVPRWERALKRVSGSIRLAVSENGESRLSRFLFDLVNSLMGESQQVCLVARAQVQPLAEPSDCFLERSCGLFLEPLDVAPIFGDLP